MSCIDYNQDLEQAHYHFVLGEVAYYVTQYGIDAVMVDIYDTLARECNTKVKQLEMEYHTYED
jgi:hypothetical protein